MTVTSTPMLGVEDLEGRIEDALMSYEPVRSSPLPLHLEVEPSGVARLEGWVRSRVIYDTIEEIVRHVPGVTQLNLSLVVDPELEVQVARALATSAETAVLAPGSVILRANLGAVRLIGRVPTRGLEASVVRVAQQVEGVRRVENELAVA